MEVVVVGQAAAEVKATLREAAKPGRPQVKGHTLVERTWDPQDVQTCLQVPPEATGSFN